MKSIESNMQVRRIGLDIQQFGYRGRTVLKQILQNPRTLRPDELRLPLRVMRELMETEGMLVALSQTTENLEQQVFEDMEHELRGLRDSMGKIVANSMVIGIYEEGYRPQDYGLVVTERSDRHGFTIEIPYEMMAMSDLFMLRSKKIAKLSSLFTVRQAWMTLISNAVAGFKTIDSIYPLHRSHVHVTVQTYNRRPLDPDHFWFRPILDGLVESGIIVNDDAESVIFMHEYKFKKDHSSVHLEVKLHGLD
ncbi:hypothetical protein LLE49_26300 [Alicyclobacillus tolerans]|uniref:hypothetical protein n=1 Tax=Alicyclobacillus tolerans TaxID=90970 RepID=UPI001F2B75CC|nr:hypothetical protein [Alicyclobacillus tolerans]MCF8568238.1 hypothetical protein [Alicyclobacillus tolerans]